jgi:hypothetical protein
MPVTPPPSRHPLIPACFVRTEEVDDAELKVRLTVLHGDITGFEGQPGMGKTTTCAWATSQQDLDADWRYCVLPLKGNAKAVMDKVYTAVTGRPGRGTAREMEIAIIERLTHSNIGLIVDEVHHCGPDGLQQLRFLHDDIITRTGRGFPLIVCGVDVYATTTKTPELRGRVARSVRFSALDTPDRVMNFAKELHPRLAKTSPSLIERLDTQLGKGERRGWTNIAKHIPHLPTTVNTPEKALSRDDVEQLLALMG